MKMNRQLIGKRTTVRTINGEVAIIIHINKFVLFRRNDHMAMGSEWEEFDSVQKAAEMYWDTIIEHQRVSTTIVASEMIYDERGE